MKKYHIRLEAITPGDALKTAKLSQQGVIAMRSDQAFRPSQYLDNGYEHSISLSEGEPSSP